MTLPAWESLAEAQERVRVGKVRGIFCPCCNQFAKIYNRKLNSAMAHSLILLMKFCKQNEDEWINVESFLAARRIRATDFYKLKFWGLVERHAKSSTWRLTSSGVNFAMGKITVPKRVQLYNDQLLDVSSEQITVVEALGERFNYYELMAAALG